MTRTASHPGRSCPRLLGGLLVCLLPAVASGETMIFRNECNAPLVVQASHVERGLLKRDQYLLRPGSYTPQMSLDCDTLVTIYDGKTGRILFRGAMKASKVALNYGIVPARLPGRVTVMPRRTIPVVTPKR